MFWIVPLWAMIRRFSRPDQRILSGPAHYGHKIPAAFRRPDSCGDAVPLRSEAADTKLWQPFQSSLPPVHYFFLLQKFIRFQLTDSQPGGDDPG